MEAIQDYYEDCMANKSDQRTKDWLLMSSPWPCVVIIAVYLAVVKIGPQVMKDCEAWGLKKILIVYNAGLVALSVYMFWEFLASSLLVEDFNSVCQPVDYSEKPSAVRLAAVCWWYFFSKIIELLDTIFFILRKKNNQISFLHVYHHSTMVLLWWIGVRFVAGGSCYFSAMVNCFIHILMYSYYLLSAFGPHMQKYLWWKRYMTSLQLTQFVGIMIHTSLALYMGCGVPTGYLWALMAYMVSHVLLFSNFYHKTYITKKQKQTNGIHSNGHSVKQD